MLGKVANKVRFHRSIRFYLRLFVIALISVLGAVGVAQGVSSVLAHPIVDQLALSGLKALSAPDLEKLVREEKLVAYWVGPEEGFRYLLNTLNAGEVSIKYVPQGAEPSGVIGRTTRSSLREIVSYTQENAFATVRGQSGSATCQNFLNGDGNAVYLDSAVPGLIYIGIKDKPIQVVMFDPNPTRNLALACEKSGLIQVGKS